MLGVGGMLQKHIGLYFMSAFSFICSAFYFSRFHCQTLSSSHCTHAQDTHLAYAHTSMLMISALNLRVSGLTFTDWFISSEYVCICVQLFYLKVRAHGSYILLTGARILLQCVSHVSVFSDLLLFVSILAVHCNSCI